MSAWRILGPNGRPIVTSNGAGHILRENVPTGTELALVEQVDKQWATDVQKKVRSTSVSLMALQDRERGKPKPTPVTEQTLRLMAKRNEWVGAAIKTRKNQVSGTEWDITLKDTDDPSGAARKAAKSIKKLLLHPMMHGSSVQTTTWRQFIGMYVEDLLTLDRAAIEKERDGQKWIVALYPVDGATIRPNMDDRGGFHDDAYKQVVDGVVTASFGMEDLVVGIDNPQTDVRYAGYGMSPLERLVISITADLHAARYNAEYFTKGTIPEGMLHLGEEIDPDSVLAFQAYWLNEIQGRPNSLPIIGGSKGPEFIRWRDNNRDMQFMEYQQWLLQKICAGFQMTPKDLGSIDDVNRSTAEDATSNQESKGLTPLLAGIKDMLDLEIIGEHGQGLGDYLEFTWEQAGESADEINAKYQPMVESGAATRGEWRGAHGMDEDGDPKATHGKEGLRMHLAPAQPVPLPTSEDADVSGAAHQQQREDEQAQQQMAADKENANAQQQDGGEPTSVPWQPADPDHPDVKDAMAQHDDEAGIGPRNVGKTTDRHPALTRGQEDLDDVFAHATARLVDGLANILGSE